MGVWLGWDINNPLGQPHLPRWQQSTDYLKERLDEDLASNMMLSHDWNVVLSWTGIAGFPKREENPDEYLWLSRAVIPHLKDSGASQDVIKQMMIDNPRPILQGTTSAGLSLQAWGCRIELDGCRVPA